MKSRQERERVGFNYKGENSRDYYLFIEDNIAFPSPERDIDFVEILGRDGELAIDNERLKGVDFSLPVLLFPPSAIKLTTAVDEITQWLKSEVGWFPLQFGTEPEYEYIAMFYEQFDVERTLYNHGRTVLNFRLKPYKRKIGESTINISDGDTIFNNGKRSSKPLIEIKGSGDITIKNNGSDWLKLKSVDQKITIDSELMSVYRDDRPQYEKMIDMNSFPELEINENKITWNGNVSSMKILPRTEVIS